ncbi:hypothetical protein BGX26_003927 [Mortierella sp. AD094]|nr:hypothetical protein BGX26_003927 [Mortierella sp. AD094]
MGPSAPATPSSIVTKRDREENEESYESSTKRRCSSEFWALYTHHDGKRVSLPKFLIDMLRSDNKRPDSRADFSQLLNLNAGDRVMARSLGRSPKFFAEGVQGREFIVSEQMMDLWELLDRDTESSVKRCLTGPMGVGKSYIAWFLAAKAYAHGWPVLYVTDAKSLQSCETGEEASTKICQRFITLNKDILTVDELAKMVDFQDTTKPLVVSTAGYIFDTLLQQGQQKTLFVIDEHGAMFPDNGTSVTDRFPVLGCLNAFGSWETQSSARVMFTGTAHGKFGRTILRDRDDYLIHVGPLSPLTFDKLFDAVLAHLDRTTQDNLRSRKNNVIKITNRVPRDLIRLVVWISLSGKQLKVKQLDISLAGYEKKCFDFYSQEASNYFKKLQGSRRDSAIQALTKMFLPGRQGFQPGTFEWEFLDSGLVYQATTEYGPEYRPISLSAQRAILDLYKIVPLPESLRSGLASNTLDGNQFQEALFRELIRGSSHIFQSTDLAGGNEKDIVFNISGYELMGKPPRMLEIEGDDGKGILINGGSFARFDFMLGYMFIQVSVSSFTDHNGPKESANIDKAFLKGEDDKNQIERYLDAAFGGVHKANMIQATIDEGNDDKINGEGSNDKKGKSKRSNDKNDDRKSDDKKSDKISVKRFVVKKDGVLCKDFRIVYIRGKSDINGSGGLPSHAVKQNVKRTLTRFKARKPELDAVEMEQLWFERSPRGQFVFQHMLDDRNAPIEFSRRNFALKKKETEEEMIEYITCIFNTNTQA